MEVLFEHQRVEPPVVSIVLVDWSCRESYHMLDYLFQQTVPRKLYEVIWVEYYDKRAAEIEVGLRKSNTFHNQPIVDKWIVLGMPRNLYYHKHLMYNVGIAASSGSIVTFCDSDAVVRRTFVESIVKSFESDQNIVLHMDQVRNRERWYYPFNYPSIEDICSRGRTNIVDGKPAGLSDALDPLHTRNYGACMSALRNDLIRIGGADEHVDYLGHICGPYEMTWRLINIGRREVWHKEEWLYHVWHPGQHGAGNYFGPNDGNHMSTTALAVLKSGRILPLVENPAIRRLRVECQHEPCNRPVPEEAVVGRDFSGWKISKIRVELLKFGKWLLRKWLPRPVKNFLRTRFREFSRSRVPDFGS